MEQETTGLWCLHICDLYVGLSRTDCIGRVYLRKKKITKGPGRSRERTLKQIGWDVKSVDEASLAQLNSLHICRRVACWCTNIYVPWILLIHGVRPGSIPKLYSHVFYLPGYCKVRVIDARAGDNLLFSVMRQLLTLRDLNFTLDINRTGMGPRLVVSEETFMRLN